MRRPRTCCYALLESCFKRTVQEAWTHAVDRARESQLRQEVRWHAGYRAWRIRTIVTPAVPATWAFDGRVYEIVDTHR